MKKTYRRAIASLAALLTTAGLSLSAAAGSLSREELIQTYAPNGVMIGSDERNAPFTYSAPYTADNAMIDLITMVEQNCSSEELLAAIGTASYSLSQFNDYRIGYYSQHDRFCFYQNAEYEAGFYYIIREDGAASIVGADNQAYEESGTTVLQIPEVIGGATVKEIEAHAFEQAGSYLPGLTEIIMPDTVEIIGKSAFAGAIQRSEGNINIPANLKYLGRTAFYKCTQFVVNEAGVVELPESLEFIGARCFETEGYKCPIAYGRANYQFLLHMPESPVMIEIDTVDYEDHLEAFLESVPEFAALCKEQDADYVASTTKAIYAEKATKTLANCYKYDLALATDPSNSKAYSEYRVNAELLALAGLEAPYVDVDAIAQEESDRAALCLIFYDMYDASRQPREALIRLDGGAFLYNEVNAVTLKDVAEYYAAKNAEALPEIAAVEPEVLAGDVNANGTVDIMDAIALARITAEDKEVNVTEAGLKNADVNGDGTVTADDLNALLAQLAS